MEKKFDTAEHIELVGQELVLQFEKARKGGTDPNAKGFAIEAATRKQLELLLPSVLGVGQGYIIDSYGNVSRQIDLVIFERSLCPVFSINESPESTYYPCEGVLAALEIKSSTGRKEYIDSCEKANSVRNMKRRLNKTEDNKILNSRRYGQVELFLGDRPTHTVDPDMFPLFDILTGLITGKVNVTQDTLQSYFIESQRNAPDMLVSLDGFYGRFLDEAKILTNARLAKEFKVVPCENPFSRFIRQLYMWFCYGHTASFHAFFNYFHDQHEE